jgi:hypothetical protein
MALIQLGPIGELVVNSKFQQLIGTRLFQFGTCALLLGIPTPALAQNIPSEARQETIIKSSLLTFNDANLSGDYTVMNALGSKPFRETVSPQQLKEAFKVFSEKQLDISAVVSAKPVVTRPTVVNSDGVMITEGYFDTPNMRVSYTLKHLLSDGKWKLLGVNVSTTDPPK